MAKIRMHEIEYFDGISHLMLPLSVAAVINTPICNEFFYYMLLQTGASLFVPCEIT